MVLSQPLDITSTQMLVTRTQLSFKVRKKALIISSVLLICVLAVLIMKKTIFSVVQVFNFFFQKCKDILAELHNTQPFSSTSFSDILPGYAHYHHSNWNPSFTQFYMPSFSLILPPASEKEFIWKSCYIIGTVTRCVFKIIDIFLLTSQI